MTARSASTAPGTCTELDGVHLHAVSQGDGRPVVVLESALGSAWLQWTAIQPAVAAFTRVIAYDRAGQGWSTPSPRPRKPDQLVGELRALLARLDAAPPYILVGHSFGGLLMRQFAGHYPQEVAGLVLVDSSPVDQYDDLPNLQRLRGQVRWSVKLLTLASRIGLGNWIAARSLKSVRPYVADAVWTQLVALAGRPQHHHTVMAEFDAFDDYFGPGSVIPADLGNLPLLVVTAGSSLLSGRGIGGQTPAQLNEAHLRRQQALTRLSTQAEQIVVPDASHTSIVFNPAHAAAVINAIRRLVERARAHSTP